MGKPESGFNFQLLSWSFRIRDFLAPRKNILREVGIRPGFHVLDYGCGPGGYIIPLTKLVGKSGKIYALDSSHLAIKSVKNMIIKKHLNNVEIIHSDCKTGLSDSCLDIILF